MSKSTPYDVNKRDSDTDLIACSDLVAPYIIDDQHGLFGNTDCFNIDLYGPTPDPECILASERATQSSLTDIALG